MSGGVVGIADPEALRLGGIVVADERHDQAVLHAEYRVRIEIFIAGDEHVRGHRLEAFRADDEVDVGGTHRVATEGGQHLSHRSVGRDRIGRRLHRAEEEAAVGAGGEQAAKVHLRLAGVLGIVETVGRSLPDVEQGAGDRPAVLIEHTAGNMDGLALAVLRNAVAHLLRRGAGDVERPEHGRFRRP